LLIGLGLVVSLSLPRRAVGFCGLPHADEGDCCQPTRLPSQAPDAPDEPERDCPGCLCCAVAGAAAYAQSDLWHAMADAPHSTGGDPPIAPQQCLRGIFHPPRS
jgi:hypothetical protein